MPNFFKVVPIEVQISLAKEVWWNLAAAAFRAVQIAAYKAAEQQTACMQHRYFQAKGEFGTQSCQLTTSQSGLQGTKSHGNLFMEANV
jgi:hypothetical protein